MPTSTLDDLAREFENGSPEQLHKDFYFAAITSSRTGDLDALQEILEQWRSNPSIPDPRGEEELGWMLVHAADNSHPSIVRYLLDQKARIDSEAVRSAASHAASPEVWKAFLDNGWEINSLTEEGVPILCYIVDHEELLRWFLENGADPNLHGTKNQCALDQAALHLKQTSVEMLLNHGADLDRSSGLHIVAGARYIGTEYVSMLGFLLDRGAKINQLEHQASPEYFEKVKDQQPLGTPLHYAARRGRKDRVEFLLDRGADPNIRDTAGRLPVDSVRVSDQTGIQELLASRTKSQ
ncbi:MAG: hypothetical protein M1823_004089 [Watsoniomyces obsoletus]|nr:MAG: hypothetical protein M1823_004089 [Watsoniomyces obsoletus]